MRDPQFKCPTPNPRWRLPCHSFQSLLQLTDFISECSKPIFHVLMPRRRVGNWLGVRGSGGGGLKRSARAVQLFGRLAILETHTLRY